MMIQHLKERAVTVNNVHINPPLHNQELFLVDHTKCYVVKMQIKLPLADVLSFENSWNLFFLKMPSDFSSYTYFQKTSGSLDLRKQSTVSQRGLTPMI